VRRQPPPFAATTGDEEEVNQLNTQHAAEEVMTQHV
jgi:hypothetical protein